MNNLTKGLLILLTLSFTPSLLAKEITKKEDNWYFMWGYNRAGFDKSDIAFSGDVNGTNYNFTLQDVDAHDAPGNFDVSYFTSTQYTVPQYTYRFGYYLDESHVISFGMDHMKYVMDDNQVVPISGNTIDSKGATKTHTIGDTNGTGTQLLSPDFLKFEHTDGLNYFSADLETYSPFWKSKSGTFKLLTMYGMGAGIVIPKTNITLFDGKKYDEFALAGYGVSAKVAVQLDITNDYFIRLTLKKGYLDLQQMRTGESTNSIAKQGIDFNEIAFYAGIVY
jgi:hypothetical protein